MTRRVGQRRRQFLVANGAEEDEARLAVQFEDRVDQLVVAGREPLQSGLAVKRAGHAIAEHHNGGLHLPDLLQKLKEPLGLAFGPIEAHPRLPLGRVRAPAEIAKCDISVGEP